MICQWYAKVIGTLPVLVRHWYGIGTLVDPNSPAWFTTLIYPVLPHRVTTPFYHPDLPRCLATMICQAVLPPRFKILIYQPDLPSCFAFRFTTLIYHPDLLSCSTTPSPSWFITLIDHTIYHPVLHHWFAMLFYHPVLPPWFTTLTYHPDLPPWFIVLISLSSLLQ